MEVKQLKGYGKPLNISERLPKAVDKRIKRESMRIIRRNLGLMKMLQFLFLALRERKRMSARDIFLVRKKGLTSEKFIEDQIMVAAVFSAMSRMVGKEKALEISYEIIKSAGPTVLENMFPKPEEFSAMENPFDAFKQYYMAIVAADEEAGLHDFEVIEDGEDAFQVNLTYCAFCEIPKKLGIIEACQPSCYGDDVFFPEYCEKLGMRFIRKGTLARGNDACDFRFERINKHGTGVPE